MTHRQSDPLPPATVGEAVLGIRTPALVVDLDALERNIARMARALHGSAVALRPHAKSHKCAEIARLQVAHGAVGVCCQTVREAQAMLASGIDDVLVTNEIVLPDQVEALAQLSRKARVAVLVDHPAHVQALSRAAASAGATVRVLVEVDVGAHRCGIAPGEPAARLAAEVARAPGLVFGGIHAYQGAAQHRRTPEERAQAIADAVALAASSRRAIEAAGIGCPTVTGAGTGTWPLERASGVYTELQPGSYVFMDVDYRRNTLAPDQPAFEQSLLVVASVISTPGDDRVVVDAGLKAVAVDSGLPVVHDAPGLAYEKASDEHGVIRVHDARVPDIGERIALVPGHCDPTVNLYDWIVATRSGRVEALWPVVARGH